MRSYRIFGPDEKFITSLASFFRIRWQAGNRRFGYALLFCNYLCRLKILNWKSNLRLFLLYYNVKCLWSVSDAIIRDEFPITCFTIFAIYPRNKNGRVLEICHIFISKSENPDVKFLLDHLVYQCPSSLSYKLLNNISVCIVYYIHIFRNKKCSILFIFYHAC